MSNLISPPSTTLTVRTVSVYTQHRIYAIFQYRKKQLQSVLKIILRQCQSKIHFKNYWLNHIVIKKASLITPTYFWLLDQIKMFCVFFNARIIGLDCHNWFFLPTSIIFHPILTRTTPIFGYKWHFFTKMTPKKGKW